MRNLPVMLVQGIFALVALACGGFLFFATSNQIYAVMGGLVALALGQLLSVSAGVLLGQREEDHLAEQNIQLRELRKKAAVLEQGQSRADAQLAGLVQRTGQLEQSFTGGLGELRASYAELAQFLSQSLANDQREPAPAPGAKPAAAAAPASAAAVDPPRDAFVTSLEPVIDVSSGATAHYRVRTSMLAGDGSEISHVDLMANADQTGARPKLDLYVVREAVSLLERLRQRNATLKLFITIGAPTLMDETALRDIMSCLSAGHSFGGGLVIELPHAALVSLPERGIAGLALLARNGVAMALTDVMIAGLDLASLRQLGVKYFGLPATSINSGYGLSQAIGSFAQSARAMQFQIIVTDVIGAETASMVPQIARFASGPFFAPSRRVKSLAERERDANQRMAA